MEDCASLEVGLSASTRSNVGMRGSGFSGSTRRYQFMPRNAAANIKAARPRKRSVSMATPLHPARRDERREDRYVRLCALSACNSCREPAWIASRGFHEVIGMNKIQPSGAPKMRKAEDHRGRRRETPAAGCASVAPRARDKATSLRSAPTTAERTNKTGMITAANKFVVVGAVSAPEGAGPEAYASALDTGDRVAPAGVK